MRSRATRRGRPLALAVAALLFAAALLALPSRALAQSYAIGIAVGPGETTFLPGVPEVFARIDNATAAPIRGEVLVSVQTGKKTPLASAAFSVSPGSTNIVRIPTPVSGYAFNVEVRTNGAVVASKSFMSDAETGIRVVDLAEVSRVRALIDSLTLQPATSPGYSPRGWLARIHVATPFIDPTTGGPVAPTYVTGWGGTHLVSSTAAMLSRLSAQELRALTGFVLAGGTLAVFIEKPEDLRSPILASLVGGSAQPIAPPDACFTHFEVPFGKNDALKFQQVGDRPPESVRFTSYTGGNLRPGSFGASATYGLGEVVLLGFDPSDPATASEPWTARLLADLARRAFDRFDAIVVRPGYEAALGPYPARRPTSRMAQPIEGFLDPNTAARWSIGVASLFICGYAILAGPVSFARAKKKNQPLRALLMLPLFSIAAFVVIVLFGFVSKGVSRRTNRLTFIEAGAGMDHGSTERYRGFFSPFSQRVDVRPTLLGNSFVRAAEEDVAKLEVDGGGVHTAGLQGMPAQTVVVREEGIAPLGGTVDITASGSSGDIVVTNRLTRDLRGVIVHLPTDEFRYVGRLQAGASIASADMGRGKPSFTSWVASVAGMGMGADSSLRGGELKYVLEEADEAQAGAAWLAFDGGQGMRKAAWFPQGVPVVLAMVDGGSGDRTDAGVPVDRDVLLLRVVGWGAAP